MALPELMSYLGSDYVESEVIESVLKVIDGPDGYTITKTLELDGWCCGSRLVEIFDQDFIGDALREQVKQWVKCLGVDLFISIGTPARSRGKEGVISKLYPETAEYGLRTEEQPRTSYWVFPAEEVELVDK